MVCPSITSEVINMKFQTAPCIDDKNVSQCVNSIIVTQYKLKSTRNHNANANHARRLLMGLLPSNL